MNKGTKLFISILEDAKKYVKGELELDHFAGNWYAMDYREDLQEAFPIEVKGFNNLLITDKDAESRRIDIRKCCDICDVAYVG